MTPVTLKVRLPKNSYILRVFDMGRINSSKLGLPPKTFELKQFECYIGYNGKGSFSPKIGGQRSYPKN